MNIYMYMYMYMELCHVYSSDTMVTLVYQSQPEPCQCCMPYSDLLSLCSADPASDGGGTRSGG